MMRTGVRYSELPLRESLSRCLRYAHLRDCPSLWDGRAFWLRAIVLVCRQNMNKSYAVCERAWDGRIRYVYDGYTGCASPIVSISGIYPYEVLDSHYMRGRNDRYFVSAVCRYHGMSRKEVGSMDDATFEYYARAAAIDAQRSSGGNYRRGKEFNSRMRNAIDNSKEDKDGGE